MNDAATYEFDPLLLYREDGDRAEFATWRLAQERPALAIFFDREAVERYRQAANLDDRWRILQPDRPTLLRILLESRRAGIAFAVLDPDAEKARRVFDLDRIVVEGDGRQFPGEGAR